MAEKLTQATVNRAAEDHPPGTQLYDAEASGLCVIVERRHLSR
ncbi:hypothetical protein [Rhodovulum visakhapatnamense]|nr:hypothetical protein [Rhodovulum visakhapatnamense]